MPLVDVLRSDQAPLLARPFFATGDPGPIAATMAHVPELLEVALPFLGAALSPGGLDFRTKEIAILRTSALMECRYCVDSHTPVAIDAGLSHTEVHALRNESAVAEAFPGGRDRAVIAWIDTVAAGPGPVSVTARTLASEHLSQAEIVELTIVVGTTLLLNRYATSLGLPVNDETLARLAREGMART